MAIKKYTGELGKFSYDDTVFKLEDKGSDIEYLHYIGDEVDGKKIEIPNGIVNCFMMFANNENLESCPEIPDSDKFANMMFYHCTKITQTVEVYSKNLLSASSMYEGCRSLVDVFKMPPTIEDCSFCFKDCISMQKCMITLPANLQTVESMYEGCVSLTQSPKLLMGCKNCKRMFANCVKLKTAPQLHAQIENVDNMYLNCTNMVSVPSIPLEARKKILGMTTLRPNVSEYPTKGKNKERKEAKKKAIKAKKFKAKQARQAAKLERIK